MKEEGENLKKAVEQGLDYSAAKNAK